MENNRESSKTLKSTTILYRNSWILKKKKTLISKLGDFNTPLRPMDRSTKQKINKETQILNDTIDQLDLIYIYRTFYLKTGDTYRLKVKGWKKIFHANRDQKKAGVAKLISDKIDFKTKAVKRDKEGHYIVIKGSIQE